MWDERRRDGGRKGLYQLGTLDVAATIQVAEDARKQRPKGTRLSKQSTQRSQPVVSGAHISDDSNVLEEQEDDDTFIADTEPPNPSVFVDSNNWLNCPLLNVAREAERYKLSNRAVSCICTALLVDLGIITEEDTRHIIDKSKIYRNREIIRKKEIKTGNTFQSNFIQGISFDGRKDKTLVVNECSRGIRKEKEEHYSVLQLPSKAYLTHFTPLTGGSKDIKDKQIDVIKENNLTPCMKVASCDSTNVNTGRRGGVITLLEQYLGHRLLWLPCMLLWLPCAAGGRHFRRSKCQKLRNSDYF